MIVYPLLNISNNSRILLVKQLNKRMEKSQMENRCLHRTIISEGMELVSSQIKICIRCNRGISRSMVARIISLTLLTIINSLLVKEVGLFHLPTNLY